MTNCKKRFQILAIALAVLLMATPSAFAALAPPEPETPESLALVRLKITGEEYIEIQNNSSEDIDDLSLYALRSYSNVNAAAVGATASSQSFPALKLKQGARLLLSRGIRPTCGASISGRLSLTLVDGGGTVQIVRLQDTSDLPVNIIDFASWSSVAKGEIQFAPSFGKAPLTSYYRYDLADGTYAWQKADQNPESNCELMIADSTGSSTVPIGAAPGGTTSEDESFTVETKKENLSPGSEGATEKSDINLASIVISEILPNPIGAGNDAIDEFIELYNPNESPYDLSGYVLRTGVSTMRYYTFPPETVLPTKSYAVYSSSLTELLLSNAAGQVTLLNPDKTVMVSTEIYRSAKDGQSWLQSGNRWQWSSTPTPGKENLITAPIAPQKNAATSTSVKKSVSPKTPKAPKAAKALKPKKEKKPKTDKAAKYSATPTAATVESRPIQTRVIAIVALIALLYGTYEYRGDLANKLQQCRRYVSAWRPHRR